jgi:hypothetical protein
MKHLLAAAILSTPLLVAACTGGDKEPDDEAKPFKPAAARALTPKPYLNPERLDVCDLLTSKEQSALGARGGVPLLDFAEDGFITCSESAEPTIRWGSLGFDEGIALSTRVDRGWKPLKGVGDEAFTTTSNEHAVVARFDKRQLIISDRSDDPRPVDELADLMRKMGTRVPADPDEFLAPQLDENCPAAERPPVREALKKISGQIMLSSGHVSDDGSLTCSYVAEGGTIINMRSAKAEPADIEGNESEDRMSVSSKQIRLGRVPGYLYDSGTGVRITAYAFTDRTAEVEVHMSTSSVDYKADQEPDARAARQLAAAFVKTLRP